MIDVLFVHPFRHHIYPAIAALHRAGFSVRYCTLLYKKGLLGRLLAYAPGAPGKKITGYHHPEIPASIVRAPFAWQLKRIVSRDLAGLVLEFDQWVASRIRTGQWKARAYHLLQDYLPETAKAVVETGGLLVSDQISNSSQEARWRAKNSWDPADGPLPSFEFSDSEEENDWILQHSDVVLVPSQYVLEGIKERISPRTQHVVIPYGTNVRAFREAAMLRPRNKGSGMPIVIVARAPSPRKGGHLLLKALAKIARTIREMAGREVVVHVLGGVNAELASLMQRTKEEVSGLIRLESGAVPHSVMPRFLASVDLLVMPSLSEGCSLFAPECAAAGLPLLVTPYCGIDRFKDGRHGVLAPDATVEAVTHSLIRAFQQQNHWREWGENAANEIPVDNECYGENIVRLYREILS